MTVVSGCRSQRVGSRASTPSERLADSVDSSSMVDEAVRATERELAGRTTQATNPVGPVEGQVSLGMADVIRYVPDPIELKKLILPRLQDLFDRAEKVETLDQLKTFQEHLRRTVKETDLQELQEIANLALDAETVDEFNDDFKAKLNDRLDELKHLIKQVRKISRELQKMLSLRECISRTVANNFLIRTDSFGPAISAMDILKAESAFDTVFFADSSFQKLNQPTASELLSGDSDRTTLTSGLRKLLPTGGAVSGTYNLTRLDTELQFATLNPSYTNNLTLELRQPLLRGAGVDFARSGIEVSKNNWRVAKYEFRKKVRDVLADVEKTYWRLGQARRALVVQRILVEQTRKTQKILEDRRAYDVVQAMVDRATALSESRQADYISFETRVRDLEDQLKTLMNDPDLSLGDDVEIMPTDFPTVTPLVLDQIAEVQAAVTNRSELHQARLNIENARINVMVTKNQALPKLDFVFRYTSNGLDSNPGRAFDGLSASNFLDYFVGLSFEYPLGNRGPRAEMTKARLQRDQALAALQQVIEGVILEVHVAVRNLQNAYNQVQPRKKSVEAAEANVESIQLRKERLSPEYLDVQLNAQATLADARRGLLAAMVEYRIALIDLERAKDTLLQYNNVTIEPARAE